MLNKQKTRAFTLIELLVVISIIALLVSILMPALGKAKKQAKRMVCSSNLHHWGIVHNLYASDNNDKIMETTWMDTPDARNPFVIVTDYITAIAPARINNIDPADTHMLTIERLQPYVEGVNLETRTVKDASSSIFVCPSNQASVQMTSDWNNMGYIHTPYQYFGHVKTWADSPLNKRPDLLKRDLTDKQFGNAGKLLMADILWNWGAVGGPGYGWMYNHGHGPASKYHGSLEISGIVDEGEPDIAGTNQLFSDGHVKWKNQGEFDLPAMGDYIPAIPWIMVNTY